jgi:hypothetical protein
VIHIVPNAGSHYTCGARKLMTEGAIRTPNFFQAA